MNTDTLYTGAIIRTPGKFEAEPDWLESYYGAILNGCADDTVYDGDDVTDVFYLTGDDWPVKLGDAAAGDVLLVWETSQGFVGCEVVTRAECDRRIATLDDDTEEGD